MSRTKLHKQKGLFKNGFEEEMPNKLFWHYSRHHGEFSDSAKNRQKLKDKILNNCFKDQLNDNS